MSAFFMICTSSKSSALASSTPATSLNVTLLVSSTLVAFLRVLPPPLCRLMAFLMKIMSGMIGSHIASMVNTPRDANLDTVAGTAPNSTPAFSSFFINSESPIKRLVWYVFARPPAASAPFFPGTSIFKSYNNRVDPSSNRTVLIFPRFKSFKNWLYIVVGGAGFFAAFLAFAPRATNTVPASNPTDTTPRPNPLPRITPRAFARPPSAIHAHVAAARLNASPAKSVLVTTHRHGENGLRSTGASSSSSSSTVASIAPFSFPS